MPPREAYESRSAVRLGVAFWGAADRRSIKSGPEWLWRGPLWGPVRESDLPAAVADKILRRRHTMPREAVVSGWSPRSLRLPHWISARTAVRLTLLGMMLMIVAVICLYSRDDRLGLGVVAGWLAAATLIASVPIWAGLAWIHQDPLRLTRTDSSALQASYRMLDWNPLAGEGKPTAGGAYALEGIEACNELRDHPGWALPGLAVLRSRFDPDEEIFQIARAAMRMDQLAEYVGRNAMPPNDIGATTEIAARERSLLEDALFSRLVALRSCVNTLGRLQEHADSAAGEELPPGFGAVVENELASEDLNNLNGDLVAMVSAYAAVDRRSSS